uniref:Uncharacterized protein n=1 Tax=Scophthalmus maximus TaxID=52904 RepID=A0A8D3CWC9_SCOMX
MNVLSEILFQFIRRFLSFPLITYIFKFFKNNRTLFSWRRDKIESNDGKNKFIFTLTNGTLRINSLSQNDTDIYELITYNSDGIRLEVWTLHLSIQGKKNFF